MKVMAALLLILISGPLYGQITDGMSLLKGVTLFQRWSAKESGMSQEEKLTAVMVLGYFRGAEETIALLNVSLANNTPFRLPEGVTTQQLVLVVKKYAEAHPEELHKPASWIMFNAFGEAFPNQDFKLPEDSKPQSEAKK